MLGRAECKECTFMYGMKAHGKKDFIWPKNYECCYDNEWFPDAAHICPEFVPEETGVVYLGEMGVV